MADRGPDKPPANSLFNSVFLPDDLLAFPVTVTPTPTTTASDGLPPTITDGPPAATLAIGESTREVGLEPRVEQESTEPVIASLKRTMSQEETTRTYINLFNSNSNTQNDLFDSIVSNPSQGTPRLYSPNHNVAPEPPQSTTLPSSGAFTNTGQLFGNSSVPPSSSALFPSTTATSTTQQYTASVPVSSYFNPAPSDYPQLAASPAEVNLAAPTEIIPGGNSSPLLSVGQAPQIPPAGKTNNFRMNNGKPVYAQYPGLTSPPAATTTQFNGTQGITDNWGSREYATGNPATAPPPTPLVYTPTPTTASVYSNQDMGYSFGPVPPAFNEPLELPVYKPVAYHWFYRKDAELWKPFSLVDSNALEAVHSSHSPGTVAVEGGRFDVDVTRRICTPVYWEDSEPTQVQRCSWFYKGPMDNLFVPYGEEFSARLEEEYALAMRTNAWNKRLEIGGGEAIVFHSASVVVHFCPQASADEWGSLPENQLRPRVVKRGVDGVQLPNSESTEIAHLVFLVHGIGSFCDFKFRTVVETVDDFRNLSAQLLQTHFKGSTGRVEFLPVQWHKALHGDGGIDEKLKPITLKSIPKLRHFTNDTLLDILFYTSPVYCQTIMDTVGKEMNRMYDLFLQRNPYFNAMSVAVAGHSLGSLILFDLLAHQPQIVQNLSELKQNCATSSAQNQTGDGVNSATGDPSSRMVSYTVGSVGTGHPFINYPVLNFHPTAFFALGSPIAMFVTVRGLDNLGKDFHFPTCPAFFNIFHPFDPVAYRIESLIDPSLDLRPVLVPHHKGRKRFHLELKETMARVGADFKHKVLESIRLTWNTVSQLTSFASTNLEQEVDNAMATEIPTEEDSSDSSAEKSIPMGSLNGGRRVDYVLQEAPHQILNEYLFALSSHVCYWESDDTVLLIMNEILNQGLSPSPSPDPTITQSQGWPTPDASYGNPIQYNSQVNNQGSLYGQAQDAFRSLPPPPTQGFVSKE